MKTNEYKPTLWPLAKAASIALALASASHAAPVTGWNLSGSIGGFQGGSATTASPVIGDGVTANNGGGSRLYASLNGGAGYTLTNVGDTITLTGSVSYVGNVTSGVDTAIRLGLFDVNGSPDLNGWLGYYTAVAQGSTVPFIRERGNPNTGEYPSTITGLGAAETITGTALGSGNPYVGNGVTTFSLKLELLAGGDVKGTSSIINGGKDFANVTGTFLFANNGSSLLFNRVGFLVIGGLNPEQVAYSNIDVTYTPFTPDVTPPVVNSMVPMAPVKASRYGDLKLTFSEPVVAASGNIVIHLANGTVVETIPAASVTISGPDVTINPAANLALATSYYVTIGSGAFTDLTGNPYAGISSNTAWAFTTRPLLMAYYPFDSNFTDASGSGNNLTIAEGTPTITTTSGERVFGSGALDVDSTISTQEFLNLTQPITFVAKDPWSVSFWARRRPGTDDRSGMVLGNPDTSTDFIWLSNNPAQVDGMRFRSSDNLNANFGGFPDDNQFHHWVLISDGAGNISAYRDNVPQPTVAASSEFSVTSVAQAFNSPIQSMDGQIDELYIYSEVIDATKVNELFTGASGSPYATWASGALFDQDANSDGVKNGMAWLLGANTPAANASGLLPAASQDTGKLVMNFTCLKVAGRGTAVLKLQYSKDLGITDPWTSHEAVVPDANGTVNGVVFTTSVNANPALINVQAEIPASAASPGTRLFGRLMASP